AESQAKSEPSLTKESPHEPGSGRSKGIAAAAASVPREDASLAPILARFHRDRLEARIGLRVPWHFHRTKVGAELLRSRRAAQDDVRPRPREGSGEGEGVDGRVEPLRFLPQRREARRERR